MAPVEFVNRLDEIVATFEDVSGTGLNLTSAGSAIAVTGPNGEVEGVQTSWREPDCVETATARRRWFSGRRLYRDGYPCQ